MKRLNLLFITQDNRKNIDRLTYYLQLELDKLCNLMVWHESGNIHEILASLPFPPDFVLLNDQKPQYLPDIEGLATLTIPFGALMCDLHWRADLRKMFITDNRIMHIFTHYRDKFLEWYPEFTDRIHWLPWFANTKLFRDYGLSKDIDFLLMGSVNWAYPLRQKILNTMGSRKGFVYHPHPGYREIAEQEEEQVFVGEKYAREINRSKMFFTCDSVFRYPVAKYYEVLACKTLLLAPCPDELLDLGFVPDRHFVMIDENNFLERAVYYLHHADERDEIAARGYKLVQTRHSSSVRAAELVEHIHVILQS